MKSESALSELRSVLRHVALKDFIGQEAEIEERLERYKFLILQIAKYGKADFTVCVEGTEFAEFEKRDRDLKLLERGNLIKSETRYTERNAYREYTLTVTGDRLAKKLLEESSRTRNAASMRTHPTLRARA